MTPPTPVDLTNCDREPIHTPGAIQPHGVLFAGDDADFTVLHVSANVAAFLGIEADDVLGHPIGGLFTPASAARLADVVAGAAPADVNPLVLTTANGRTFDALLHRSVTPGSVILELEPHQNLSPGFHPSMRAIVRQLQRAASLGDLLDAGAGAIRTLTGFDRVMVYRFDRDWNGEVVAESRREDLEPFLGLHYPAADIPAQARRLYALNWLRLIPDVGYTPVPLVSAARAGGDPLDLSFSVLRSVSPVHIEYLQNMRVTASMSASLIRDGALIGLIACHHYAGPHHVSFVIRDTTEFLAQAISWHAGAFEARETAQQALLAQRAEASVAASMASAASVPEGLNTPALLDLTGASGAAVLYERQVHLIGRTPAAADVARIVASIRPADDAVQATDHLASWMPDAAALDDVAAGVLAVEISRELNEYVLWFRPASERVVNWAGDPRKLDVVDDVGVARLSPRGSFALWREAVRGRALPWEPWHLEAAADLRRLLLGGVRRRSDELRVRNTQLSDADRIKDEFLATVSHELRTPLNAMLGWIQILQASEAAGGTPLDPERRRRAFETIERNARAQAQVIDDLLDVGRIVAGKLTLHVQPVDVANVVELALDAMRPAADARRIRLQSAVDATCSVMGDPGRLQQVVVNLLSNAVKFTPKDGRVQVIVQRLDSSVEVSVADTGQGIDPDFLPHVFERFSQAGGSTSRRASGLGLGLAIVRHLVELHGGTVSAHSDGAGRGATFAVRLPLSVSTRRTTAPAASARPGLRQLDCPPGLAGLRILVVDDDPDAREMLRLLLQECRCEVTTVATAGEALQALDTAAFDVLISDIGMPAVDGFMLMDALRRRPAASGGRIPAIALTAHARVEDRTRALNAGFNSHVPKPVEPMELFAVIASLRR